MDMDLNNRLTEDETLEQAYDIFLELAADNLDPADVLLFNLQFEERGGAELFDPAEDWQEHVDFALNPDFFAEVVIGLATEPFCRVTAQYNQDMRYWLETPTISAPPIELVEIERKTSPTEVKQVVTMDMDLNNRLTEDETLEQAYDIFLELAADNLDPDQYREWQYR